LSNVVLPPLFWLEESDFYSDVRGVTSFISLTLKIGDFIPGCRLKAGDEFMSASMKRTVVGSLAALAIVAASVGASAAPWPPGKGGGGGGAPHMHNGGNWHGGGGGGGHWHGGGWAPAAVGLGILGLAAGAAAASQEEPGYGDGCMAYRPVYDGYGNYMGRRPVNVC
jgi:hypothetical protein